MFRGCFNRFFNTYFPVSYNSDTKYTSTNTSCNDCVIPFGVHRWLDKYLENYRSKQISGGGHPDDALL